MRAESEPRESFGGFGVVRWCTEVKSAWWGEIPRFVVMESIRYLLFPSNLPFDFLFSILIFSKNCRNSIYSFLFIEVI